MIRAILAALTIALSAPVSAEPFPALYDVVDVASDDVLNIRAEPSASAEIVGSLTPDATGIEVLRLGPNGRWARVRAGERMGWAAKRFLAAVPMQGDGFGQGLSCGGTEPFWSLNYTPFSTSTFEILGEATDSFDLPFPQPAAGRLDVYGLSGPGESANLYGILKRAECSDGMSDIEYGLSLDLILAAQDTLVYSGCCSLGAR